MISIFGIISVVVALISVATIVLHNRLMFRRAPVDSYFAALDDMLRETIENLYRKSPPGSYLRKLCHHCAVLDLNGMIEALPDINRACETDLHIDEHEDMQAIYDTIGELNQAIEKYNHFITGNRPMVFMAQMLTLSDVQPISMAETFPSEGQTDIAESSDDTP